MNNPYGSYTRHNTTTAEHMAALWKEVAREHAARSSSARQHARDCHDSMDAAIRRANKAEFDAATHLADRDAAEEERDEAVQERDELRQIRRRLLGKVDQLEVKLRDIEGTEPRPLDSEVADKEWLDARYEAALDQVGGDKATHLDPMTIFMIGAKWDRQYAEPRPLTAREHLQLAWDAAHVPADGIIPAGAAYLMRSNRTGRVVTPTGDWAAPVDLPASETWGERRLLDPPTPSRPDGAEEIEAVLRDEWTFSDEDGGEDAFADLAERLASRGVRVVTEEEGRHATDE